MSTNLHNVFLKKNDVNADQKPRLGGALTYNLMKTSAFLPIGAVVEWRRRYKHIELICGESNQW
jgi:hypothetical protein